LRALDFVFFVFFVVHEIQNFAPWRLCVIPTSLDFVITLKNTRCFEMKYIMTAVALIFSAWVNPLRAEEQISDTPKPVPATRPEMKAALEALKSRTPRLPLPQSDAAGGVNNGRMRAAYLPESWGASSGRGNWSGRQGSRDGRDRSARFGQNPDSAFDYAFSTSLFWIVSRGNNCHYCLGHQELKLRGAGLDDDTIASLDSDWSRFDSRHQAALAYARKLTLEPQLVGDADIAALKPMFSDAEIIEMTHSIARFNATNRWTDGMGIPQDSRFGEEDSRLDTPTSGPFQSTVSVAAPTTRASRPGLPSSEEVAESIAACREREARVALPGEDDARKALTSVKDRAPFNWERAMTGVPGTGAMQVSSLNTIMSDEHLPVRLKAELALISAVHNRAWYAVAHAAHRLQALGVPTEEMVVLFDRDAQASNKSAAAYHLAAKLTADPHLITDADIARVREEFSDRETAQIVHVICMSNMFDRFTEALGLPLEDGICE
jgi:alkylhydroperoxidase family enzyme